MNIVLIDPPLFNSQSAQASSQSFAFRNITMSYARSLSKIIDSPTKLTVVGKFERKELDEDALVSLNIPTRRWHVRNVMFMFVAYLYMAKKIRDLKPSVIHTCDYFLLAVAGMANPQAQLFLTTPGNVFERSVNNDNPYDFTYIAALKWSLAYLKHIQHRVHIMATSPYMALWYQRTGFKTDKIEFLPLPNTNNLESGELLNIRNLQENTSNDSHYDFLFVGDLREDNNVFVLLKLLERLTRVKGEFPEICLHIVGDGYQLDKVVNYSRETQKNFTLQLHRRMVPDALRRIYLESDVLLVPRRFNATPRVVLEAFSAGLPIIANGNPSVNLCGQLKPYVLNIPFDEIQPERMYKFLENVSSKESRLRLHAIAEGLFDPRVISQTLYHFYQLSL